MSLIRISSRRGARICLSAMAETKTAKQILRATLEDIAHWIVLKALKETNAEERNAARSLSQSANPHAPPPRARPRRSLQAGDVFVTRHSNLADVHAVFHLIVDDTLKSGDINSRHPVILGLRNILKTACCNDVTSVTLPLLLTHELTDAMTAAWCMRRAELVLKCVKGFMLEMAGWGGAELRSLQLAAPAGIAPALFHSLATQLPEVFRTPTPRYFTTNADNTA